ncbi:MAG: DNA translocase FtsK [Candidatus Omnitrophica bacterium]|nr:DNA translocase FtsK [Candidatus Omnitrophota bacterium]
MERNSARFVGIFLLGLTVFLFLCLISYDPLDPCFGFCQSGYPVRDAPVNFGGKFGANVSASLFFMLGWISYLCVLSVFLYAWSKTWKKEKFTSLEIVSCAIFILILAGFVEATKNILCISNNSFFPAGGIAGLLISNGVGAYFGAKGGFFLLAITAAGLLIASWKIFYSPFENFSLIFPGVWKPIEPVSMPKTDVKQRIKKPLQLQTDSSEKVEPVTQTQRTSIPDHKEEVNVETIHAGTAEKMVSKKQATVKGVKYQLPSLSFLKAAKQPEKETEKDLRVYAQVIEETLNDFGIEGEVVNFTQGPRVTLYEVQPAPGIPLVKITKLADNIAMSLKASPIRMVAPIPGKSTIGIEVPNREISIVCLKEILESKEFQSSPSKLTIAIGKNILGKPVISDLKIMPHLLIAGATGSGKTVCLNSLITSILYKATAEEVKFIMIDPKMVELVIYNDIPHLILPVITDIKKAVNSLKWLIREMDRRYHLFAQTKVRNIELYNHQAQEKLPYVVVVVDELADLMLISRNEIENSIIRLTALSRAAGIHLILATQRPSVNVITGIIKANLPCRIAFQVSSKFDSQTILDSKGAEKLLGRGDLLFIPPGRSHPVRAQGGYVSDEELEEITGFLKSQGAPEYKMDILEHQPESNDVNVFDSSSTGSEDDELYTRAVRIVLETRIASISMLQRRLEIGFNRAARLIERMEQEGIVGPYREGKPRVILKGAVQDKDHDQANPRNSEGSSF